MNGKDFLLSLDRKKLFEAYYNDYCKDNIILQNEMKENKADPVKTVRNAFDAMMRDIEDTIPTTNSQYNILLLPYFDTDYEDDTIYESADPCLVDMETLDRTKSPVYISDKSEIPKEFLFDTYSMMFIDRAELLGYEMLFIPEGDIVYRLAASYLNELCWFGYSNESNADNMKEEKEKLDKAIEESKDPANLKRFSIDDLYKEFGIEPPTEEEKKKSMEMTEKIIVMNYNKKVEYYNKYVKESKE